MGTGIYIMSLMAPLFIAGAIKKSMVNVPSLEASGDLSFLFAAFVVTWASLFGYLFYLFWKEREVRKEIRAITQMLGKSGQAEGES